MKPRPFTSLFFLFLYSVTPTLAQEQGEQSAVEFFPRTRIFPKLLADGTAQQFSLNKDLRTRRWIGGIGGSQRIVEIPVADLRFQLSVGATVYTSLYKTPNVLQVVTADFFVEIPLDLRLSDRVTLRTGYGHYSAHFADDGIELLNLRSVNYAKDYIPLLCAIAIQEVDAVVYGGIRFDYYTIPEYGKHWIVQWGMQGGNLHLAPWVSLYGAVDIKLRSEVAWGATQSYQAGVKFLETDSHALRLAFTVRSGIDERGQFYRTRSRLHLLGLYFDF